MARRKQMTSCNQLLRFVVDAGLAAVWAEAAAASADDRRVATAIELKKPLAIAIHTIPLRMSLKVSPMISSGLADDHHQSAGKAPYKHRAFLILDLKRFKLAV